MQSLYRSLFRRVSDDRTLDIAWDFLSSHGGQGPGPNGLTYADYPRDQRWEMIRHVKQRIRSGHYYLGPVRKKAIPKASGRGSRKLTLTNIENRMVERAIVSILQAIAECFFLPTSYGYRPERSTWHALLEAERLAGSGNRYVWITQDLRNAFDRVPLGRLMGLVKDYFQNPKLTELISQVLQVREKTTGGVGRGIRQGGSLSPLLLNLYLHHYLDIRWQQRFPHTPLLRYADDLLILCRDLDEAMERHRDLEGLLLPTGMELKHPFERALSPLRENAHVEWLGFIIRHHAGNWSYAVADAWFEELAKALRRCHDYQWSSNRARQVIGGRLQSVGPAFSSPEAINACILRLQPILHDTAFAEVMQAHELNDICTRAWRTWMRLRQHSSLAMILRAS